MADSLKGVVYLIGHKEGPVKVGFTLSSAKGRLGSIRRQWGDHSISIIGEWTHEKAVILERLTHVYLRESHYTREWFDVTAIEAENAIASIIELLKAKTVRKKPNGTLIEKYGICPRLSRNCFGVDGGIALSNWQHSAYVDWVHRKAIGSTK